MLRLQKKIKQLDDQINWYIGLQLFEFLFSIEDIYRINKGICAFSF